MESKISIRFTRQDAELFSAASHDTNPLHLSESYARKTAYGEPVIFGVLGALAALGRLHDRPGLALSDIVLEFRNPLYVGIDYLVEEGETTAGRTQLKVYDAGRLAMTITCGFSPDNGYRAELADSDTAHAARSANRAIGDIREGLEVRGAYAPSAAYLEQVMGRWELPAKGITPIQVAALMWSSYLVGMELPGERALFWRLELRFSPDGAGGDAPLSYDATVARVDERLDLVETMATLRCAGVALADARVTAFVRAASPEPSIAALDVLLPRSRRLEGKVALVIGGSRGLGAAISQALALQGCTALVNYRHSSADAERLAEELSNAVGCIKPMQGDATDVAQCQGLLERIRTAYGGLDILVCNASPPIRPLGFTPDGLARYQEFVSASVALVSVPMAVFLPALSERRGWNIVISSQAVDTLPAEWPHYVTAKYAIEGLARWGAATYKRVPCLLVRPPKLLTDQMNTPLGRQGALPVERVAAAIMRHPGKSNSPRVHGMEIMDEF